MNQNRRSSDSDTVIKVAEATINIEHLKRSNDEVRGDMREVKGEIRTLREEMIEMKAEFHIALDQVRAEQKDGIQSILKRMDAASNQVMGASKLVRAMWFIFPTLCAVIGWVYAKWALQ